MCVVVEAVGIGRPVWDPARVAIALPVGLTSGQALQIVRRILAELRVGQPAESTMEAVCFCGEPVQIPGLLPCRPLPLIPRQRTREPAEISYAS